MYVYVCGCMLGTILFHTTHSQLHSVEKEQLAVVAFIVNINEPCEISAGALIILQQQCIAAERI